MLSLKYSLRIDASKAEKPNPSGLYYTGDVLNVFKMSWGGLFQADKHVNNKTTYKKGQWIRNTTHLNG